MSLSKARRMTVVVLPTLAALIANAWADAPPTMKMTTPTPAGIATPDTLETSIGTLTSFDGVPDKGFWSFTPYDNQTRSMLQTDQRFPGVDNLGDVQANADGSYDIYFGPEAPEGMGRNWIQTVRGKGWNTIFRLYGPQESFYDKTWKPSAPALVE